MRERGLLNKKRGCIIKERETEWILHYENLWVLKCGGAYELKKIKRKNHCITRVLLDLPWTQKKISVRRRWIYQQKCFITVNGHPSRRSPNRAFNVQNWANGLPYRKARECSPVLSVHHPIVARKHPKACWLGTNRAGARSKSG